MGTNLVLPPKRKILLPPSGGRGCKDIPTQKPFDFFLNPNFSNKPWDGSVVTSWYDPKATEFEIYTGAELAGLAKLVRDGNGMMGKKIKLMADINLNNVKWTPIGAEDHSFKGVFDGQNHTVSNVVINDDSTTCTGFFARTEYERSAILNLRIVKANITGKKYTGGIVGFGNVNTDKNYPDTGIRNCYFSGVVNGTEKVGGIVGWSNLCVVDNCTVENASINASIELVGGIAGRTQVNGTAEIINCTVKDTSVTLTNPDVENDKGAAAINSYLLGASSTVIKNNKVENVTTTTNGDNTFVLISGSDGAVDLSKVTGNSWTPAGNYTLKGVEIINNHA